MLRAALNAIATEEPEWLQSWVPQAGYRRYGVAIEEYRIPAKSSERTALGEQVGRDGMELLERLWQTETPGSLRILEASERLRQHWSAHFYYEEGIVKLRPADWMPASGRRFDSPYEPDSRYGNKRSQTWHGYKVHVSETCEPGQVHLITQVRTTPAQVRDIEMTTAIHAELARKSLLPSRHFVDAGYVDAELLVSRQRDYGIELIGPVRPDPSWQANQPEAYDASRFSIDWETRTVTCPQGQSNTSWTTGSDPWNNPVITVNFGKKTCRECPTRKHCTRSLKYPRSLTLHLRDQQEALQKARQLQVTVEWRKEYQTRAGIEGTISQAVTAFGLRHNRASWFSPNPMATRRYCHGYQSQASLGVGTRSPSRTNADFAFCRLEFTS